MAEPLELLKRAFHGDDAAGVSMLLEQHPELKQRINEPIGPFDSPAICCVKSVAMLDALLAAGANIDAKSEWWAGGFGLLHVAEPELAQAAIERGATVDVHAAARLGMFERLRELIEGDPELVHARGGDGQTPLHFAATVEIAEFLLAKGAEIDARDVDHQSTPAQYMIRSRPEVARFLIARGCSTDILMATALGDEALVISILDRDPESIRTRVSDEYFPMVSPTSGGTIYQWELGWYVSAHQVARSFAQDRIFDLLMERTPADMRLTTACWLGDEATVQALAGTPLSPAEQRQIAHAARNNNLPVVRLMLRAGLPVSATSQHGATTLHWACWNGNAEMVAAILPHGPSLEDRNNDYAATPLGWATYGSEHGWVKDGDYASVVELLLKAGAERPKEPSGTAAVRLVLERFGCVAG